MPEASEHPLLDALLDSWDRNQAILVHLLRALPDDALALKPTPTSHSIGALFRHIHYVRLVFVAEDVPECAAPVPSKEWLDAQDKDGMAAMLADSAAVVRRAVLARLASGRVMDRHYDHPILMVQHMIWHEGYHHGQIKLAMKQAGRPLADAEIGRGTWGVWMHKH